MTADIPRVTDPRLTNEPAAPAGDVEALVEEFDAEVAMWEHGTGDGDRVSAMRNRLLVALQYNTGYVAGLRAGTPNVVCPGCGHSLAARWLTQTVRREAREIHAPPQARAVEAFGVLPREWHDAIAEYTSHSGGCEFYEGEPCSCSVETFRSSLYVIIAAHLGLLQQDRDGRPRIMPPGFCVNCGRSLDDKRPCPGSTSTAAAHVAFTVVPVDDVEGSEDV